MLLLRSANLLLGHVVLVFYCSAMVQARHQHKAASRRDLLPQYSNGSLDHGTDVSIDPVPVSFDAVTVSMPASQLATATPVPGDDHSIGFNSAALSASMVPTQVIPGENIPTITAPPVIHPQSPDGDDGGCMQCSLFFESVDVFYWPAASSNTDCLSQITGFSNPALPADASKFEYPSAYVVFPSISAGNSCTQVGSKLTSVTMSFAPGELSTIAGPSGATKVFNFADLPCPPPDVASAGSCFYNPPGRQYSPQIAPPPAIWDLDPAFRNCKPALFQGFDPSRAFPLISRPRDVIQPGHGLPRRARRAPALAHQLPRALTTTHGPG